MIIVIYAVQTTFVPALVTGSSPEDALLISGLTMANPRSLGVATWLVAPVFRRGALERTTAWLFVANGPVSVLGGFATAASPGWVMTRGGFVAFATWNILVVAMAALAIISMRARIRTSTPH